MSKKNDTRSAADILKAEGKLTLTADSRQDIYDQGESLVAAIPDGVRWTRTFVEYRDGQFTQSYFIIKND